MAAGSSIDVTGWLEEQLPQASPDLLRSMVQTFAEALMGAEADAVCGAAYGERSDERTNIRNGYRRRDWDTRAGSISLAIPKLRQGSYFPDWLLERRRRAEAALVTVIATSYLLGVSTRRMEKLVETLGIAIGSPAAYISPDPTRGGNPGRQHGLRPLFPGSDGPEAGWRLGL
jgi:putative transposase